MTVLNGAPASLRLSQHMPLPAGEWAWGGRDAGFSQQRAWIAEPRLRSAADAAGWAVVRALAIRAETAEGTTAQTKLSVPLGEWVQFAATVGASLQVRVSLPR